MEKLIRTRNEAVKILNFTEASPRCYTYLKKTALLFDRYNKGESSFEDLDAMFYNLKEEVELSCNVDIKTLVKSGVIKVYDESILYSIHICRLNDLINCEFNEVDNER